MSSTDSQRSNLECPIGEPFKSPEIVLKPCRVCGRTFNPQSLERHEKVCEKSKKIIQRNVFNSFSQRAKELGGIPLISDIKNEDKKKYKQCSKETSEKSSQNIKAEKNHLDVLNNGNSQQRKVPSGYQQCPYCHRCFSQKAADRHIVWCMEQQTRLPKTPPNSEALKRLKARIKYRAPLPKPKVNNDSSIRLVRSAESVRESAAIRTRSSPHIPVQNINFNKQIVKNFKALSINQQKEIDKIKPNNQDSSSSTVPNSSSMGEMPNKKAVKFKEIFSVNKKERNKNLDMLAALRLKLSEMGSSEDLLDDCFMKSESDLNRNHSNQYNLPSSNCIVTKWASDAEVHYSGSSSSSNGSLPFLNSDGVSSLEQRMPRFCYNCGTKYPVVSAKFCCECGAKRFIFGVNNNPVFAT